MCATISSFYEIQAVLIAAGITAFVTLAISLFACQTKIDFTMCSGLIFAASMVLIAIGFLYMIIALTIDPGPNDINHYVSFSFFQQFILRTHNLSVTHIGVIS